MDYGEISLSGILSHYGESDCRGELVTQNMWALSSRQFTQKPRLVTVHSKRRGKLFNRRTGKAEFKFSIGADFLNWDITRREWGLP